MPTGLQPDEQGQGEEQASSMEQLELFDLFRRRSDEIRRHDRRGTITLYQNGSSVLVRRHLSDGTIREATLELDEFADDEWWQLLEDCVGERQDETRRGDEWLE